MPKIWNYQLSEKIKCIIGQTYVPSNTKRYTLALSLLTCTGVGNIVQVLVVATKRIW